MALGDVKDRILRAFKRPDKSDLIVDSINWACEFISTQGDFAHDIVEGSIAIDSSAYAQSLVISDEFPRYRKIVYLRPSGYTLPLKRCSPDRIFEEQSPGIGSEQVDTWYRAGDNLVFKLGTLQSTMLYGYRLYPARFDIDADADETNWILDTLEACVVDLALHHLWASVGNAEEANRRERSGMKLFDAHRQDKQDG